MTSMELNRKERVILEHLISASPDARQVMRADALIWLDEGEPVDEIAQRLGISRQSVYNWALPPSPARSSAGGRTPSFAPPRRCLAATAASASKRAVPSPASAQSAFYTEPSISGAALCCC